MIGILIVSHDGFGEALIQCAGHVLGARPARVHALRVEAGDHPDATLAEGRRLVRALDQGDGVLVLADVCGATPSNVATRLLEPGRVEGLSGASLPMLMRALTYREEPLATMLERAASGGRDGVLNLGTDPCNAANRG